MNKKKKAPNYKEYDSFISKYVDKNSVEKLNGIEAGMKKFNIGKTEAKQLLNEKIIRLTREKKAEEKATLEYEKKIKAQAKEMEREQKKSDKEILGLEKKTILDELQATWRNCSDDLFQVACEIDWKKAKFYFHKRFMKENTYEVDEKKICGIKTFQDNGDMILYSKEDGVYCQNAEIRLAAEIETRFGEQSTNMQVKEIIESIRRRTYYNREDLENQPKHLRPVGNGLWDINKKELLEFSPKYVFLSKINIPHISSSKCPKFIKFVKQVLDTEKEFLVCQEWLGYCLLNDVRFSKALLLYGDGENGKSVLLNIIKYFLGQKNVTSISLQYLEHSPFAPVRLFGKVANIFADLPKKALSQTSVFKMAVAGDSLSGEKKGKDSFEFTPYAKMMFSCNEVPRSPDRTRGFFRRWIILKFNQHFPEGDLRRDENLLNKLKNKIEMEGILQFALEGLYRLIKQKGFTSHMTMAEIENFWVRHSDSVAAFTLDMIKKDSLQDAPKSLVFETYEKYCEIKNYPTEEANHFWRRFKEIIDYTEFKPKNEFGYQIRCIKGVRLLKLSDLSLNSNGELL